MKSICHCCTKFCSIKEQKSGSITAVRHNNGGIHWPINHICHKLFRDWLICYRFRGSVVESAATLRTERFEALWPRTTVSAKGNFGTIVFVVTVLELRRWAGSNERHYVLVDASLTQILQCSMTLSKHGWEARTVAMTRIFRYSDCCWWYAGGP